MNRLLFGHDEAVISWAETRLGTALTSPAHGIGIVDDDNYLRGALVLQPVTSYTAEFSMASESPRMVTHSVTKAFFRYAFNDLGLYRLQIRTPRNNLTVRRGAPKAGWKFEGVATGYWGTQNGDALMFYMTRPMCRWLKDHKRSPASRELETA